MAAFASSRGGVYMRYSDDILLVLPGGPDEGKEAEAIAIAEIAKHGEHLRIKSEKTCIVAFNKNGASLQYSHVSGPSGKNGFEYLGFRYDGKQVYVRDGTISRLYRKVSVACRREAFFYAEKNPNKSVDQLVDSYNFTLLSQRFFKVKRCDLSSEDYGTWTFYSYLKRASARFGDRGNPIMKQARSFRGLMQSRFREALEDVRNRS